MNKSLLHYNFMETKSSWCSIENYKEFTKNFFRILDLFSSIISLTLLGLYFLYLVGDIFFIVSISYSPPPLFVHLL